MKQLEHKLAFRPNVSEKFTACLGENTAGRYAHNSSPYWIYYGNNSANYAF